MKSFSNLIISLLLVALVTNVLAGENEYKATDNEELFGTWILVDYNDGTPPQKLIFKLGSYEGFYSVDAKEPALNAEYHISHKWNDSKNNIWYKTKWQFIHFHRGFSLYKISDSGKILEHIYSQWEYPKEMDISNDNYRKYKRK